MRIFKIVHLVVFSTQAAMLNKYLLACGGFLEGDGPHTERSIVLVEI